MKKKVGHLIIGLGKGGAETMLYQILKYKFDKAISYTVISFGASHYYEPMIRKLGVNLIDLDLRSNPIKALWQAYKAIHGMDVLCCWMYHANFIGYYLRKLARVPKLVWFVRHSNLDKKINKWRTLKINRYCAKMSKNVDVIAFNGIQAKMAHEDIGYCREKSIVLDNGCNCMEFAPKKSARSKLHGELNLPRDKKIILSVTKDHPIKDIPTFINAFCLLKKNNANAVAVLCGMGVDISNKKIVSICEENGLIIGQNIFFLGMRHDIPDLLAACDLYVLHSTGEAFPNSLLQAMSCGCLCLTTDVGDACRILGRKSCVVPAGEPEMLCLSMQTILSMSKERADAMRTQNRARTLECFDIHKIVKGYEELF